MINSEYMKANVTDQGLIIPKEWLSGINRVEVHKENNMITIVPASENDPILHLGSNPVSCGITDASDNPDKYLYEKL